jgi:hypothetical protein
MVTTGEGDMEVEGGLHDATTAEGEIAQCAKLGRGNEPPRAQRRQRGVGMAGDRFAGEESLSPLTWTKERL